MSTLIIRFSSLGDIVLTAAVTGVVGDVVYVTQSRYAGLAQRLPGVRQVIALEPGEGLGSLAARIPAVDRVVDLHGSLRSRALCVRLGRATQRVRKVGLARRVRVALKRPRAIQPVVERYCEAAGVDLPGSPWISLPRDKNSRTLGLVPFAAHATKEWPLRKWADLADNWEGPVVAFGGPEDGLALHQLQQRAGREITAVAEGGFEQTFEELGRVQVVVGGDTGLMHLAAVCGVPVVAIYGPTTSQDGFWCHEGRVVEAPLACRPCTPHGAATCPVGDHACMEDLSVSEVRSAVDGLLRLTPIEASLEVSCQAPSVAEDENENDGLRIWQALDRGPA